MAGKLHDVVVFVCQHAEFEVDLSTDRLVQLIYLIDWEHAREYGSPVTNVHWQFEHFAPYSREVFKIIRESDALEAYSIKKGYGISRERIKFIGEDVKLHLTELELTVIQWVLKKTARMYSKEFLAHIYETYPVREAYRYHHLDLALLAREEKRHRKTCGIPTRVRQIPLDTPDLQNTALESRSDGKLSGYDLLRRFLKNGYKDRSEISR